MNGCFIYKNFINYVVYYVLFFVKSFIGIFIENSIMDTGFFMYF